MKLGGIEKQIEITLVSRKGMLCRMLLGRTAMGGDFVIDTSRKYLASDRLKRKKRSSERNQRPKALRISTPTKALINETRHPLDIP